MSPRSKICSSAFALLVLAVAAPGQFRAFQAANVAEPDPVSVKAGETVDVPLTVRIRKGYHINSDQPAEDYLITTRLSWQQSELEIVSIEYPESELFVSKFSDEPLVVFSGEIVIRTKLRAGKSYSGGPGEIVGTLRYQACTDKACLAPTSTEVSVTLR